MADLVTLAAVRAALFFDEDEINDDSFLQDLITRVSDRVEEYCGAKIVAGEFTEYFSGDGESDEVFIANPPIISVSGLWDDTDRLFGSDVLISSSDYITWDKEGVIQLFNNESYFQTGKGNVKVTYSGGYTTVPSTVQQAVIEWITHVYRRHRDKTYGYTSKNAPGGAGSVGIDLSFIPDSVRGALTRYRVRTAI